MTFRTPIPRTYAELISILHDNALPFHRIINAETTASISHLATRLEALKYYWRAPRTCLHCNNDNPQVSQLWDLVCESEEVGLKGYVRAFEERNRYEVFEDMKSSLEASRGEAQALERELREMKGEMRELEQRNEELEGKLAAELQGGDGQQNKEMGLLVRRLDVLVERLGGIIVAGDGWQYGGGGSSDGYVAYVDDTESSASDNPLIHRPHRRPRTISKASAVAEAGSSQAESTIANSSHSEVDTRRSDPLHPSIIDAEQDKTKQGKLSEQEGALWTEEEKERKDLLSSASHFPSQSPSSPAPLDDIPQEYICIPVPPGFILPTHAAIIPSMTFRTAAYVFHFPQGATRDQLVSLLCRHRATASAFMPLGQVEGVNVIRIRTHEMEWQLKNELRKTMTKEEWEEKIGSRWVTEGQGDTYIVHLEGVQLNSVDAANKVEDGHDSPDGEIDANYRSEAHSHLRGGGPSSSQEARLDSGTQTYLTPEDYNSILDSLPERNQRAVEQRWRNYAHVLQLQNTALQRLIEHLNEIIKDMEGTIEWQDSNLDQMHGRGVELERELERAKEEASRAREDTRRAKEWWKDLQQNGVENSPMEYNRRDARSSADYTMSGGLPPAEMRGGGLAVRCPSPPSQQYTEARHDNDASSPADMPATGFLFFPGASMLVLLAKPYRYFQWPRRTSLPQIYSILQHRRSVGNEESPYLRCVRHIFEIREKMEIALPHTTDDKQVLICIPSVASGENIVGEKHDYESGPEEVDISRMDGDENMLYNNMKRMQVPLPSYQSHFSPLSSSEDDAFFNAGNVPDAIEEKTKISDNLPCMSHPSHSAEPTCSAVETLARPLLPRCPSILPQTRTSQNIPEPARQPHPARMSSSQLCDASKLVRETPRSRNSIPWAELDHLANFDYEPGLGTSPCRQEKDTAEEEQEEWQMWRHRKGQGCESWLDESKLDRQRMNCTFCHLPFVQEEWKEWEFDERDCEGEGEGEGCTTPYTRRRRSSLKQSWSMSSGEKMR